MKQIPVAIQDFMALHYVSDPRFSPDGKKIAYLVTEISREENAYLTDLWVYARASRQPAPDAERLRPRLFLGRCRHAHHLENRTWQHDSLPARCRIRFADAAVHASDCSQKNASALRRMLCHHRRT